MFKTVSAMIVAGGFIFGATPAFNVTVISGSIVAAGGGLFIPIMGKQVIWSGATPL